MFWAEECVKDCGNKAFSLLPIQTIAGPTTYLRNSFVKITGCESEVIGWLGEAFTDQFRPVNTFFFSFKRESFDQLFWEKGFDFFHAWMLLTLWTFFTFSRRFDTRLGWFGVYASNGLAIAGWFWDA